MKETMDQSALDEIQRLKEIIEERNQLIQEQRDLINHQNDALKDAVQKSQERGLLMDEINRHKIRVVELEARIEALQKFKNRVSSSRFARYLGLTDQDV